MSETPVQGQPKRLFIKTYGCQMNVYDSERMADVLRPLGYATADRPEDADFVILNTCHIREKAAEKVYSELGRLKAIRAEREAQGFPRSTIAVAGCVAQAEGEQIMLRQPAVDMVVGPQAYHQLPELLARAARSRGERLAADFAADEKFDALPAERAVSGPTAFLTVQEGCDKFCSFCVVPYTRGAEWSRPVQTILEEARALAAKGVREVTLLGQNVNAYDGAGPEGAPWTLARLARALAEIEGLDRILRAMNRKHTAESYLRLIERIRAARPDMAISGDFIVGFPGETEKDFEDTLILVREVGYASAFSFRYSKRPGTPAAAMPGQVVDEVAEDRLHRLQALLFEQQAAFNAAQAGRTLNVLFEKPGRHREQAIGRSPYLQSVHVEDARNLMGRIVPVKILSGQQNSLTGELVREYA